MVCKMALVELWLYPVGVESVLPGPVMCDPELIVVNESVVESATCEIEPAT